jgi:hypothetical protein
MEVPRYTLFIQPLLRYLAQHEKAVAAGAAYEAAAGELDLSDDARAAKLAGGKPVYRDRASWGLNWLRRAGLVESPGPGSWQLTASGRELAAIEGLALAELLSRFSSRVEVRKSRDGVVTSARSSAGPSKRTPVALGNRKAYRLPARPLAIGGQAEVFEATRKSDAKVLILKRSLNRFRNRMRREIEVQSALQHINIMPILDWDRTNHSWYVMPRGQRTMSEVARPIAPSLLLQIVDSVAAALEVAHSAGHPHRDVKPQNVIELDDGVASVRWVLADWGLTRRAAGATTAEWTKTGQLLGSEGFAPPEAYRDAHTVGVPGDVYALGQLVAWAMGVDPVPNVSSTVTGPWQSIVELMTQQDPGRRPQSMSEVRRLLAAAEVNLLA